MFSATELNQAQREAVVHEGGPLVVFAGAGSGKTRVITQRIARLIAECSVPPWRVLAVTFTNKAAGEMRERLTNLLGPSFSGLQVGTFHSICAQLLRRHGSIAGIDSSFSIYDDQDQKAAVKRVLGELSLDPKRYAPRTIANRINRAKQEFIAPDEMPLDDAFSEIAQRVYKLYQERLDQANALDFSDLLYRTVKAMEEHPEFLEEISGRFDHILVDEFQDTNHVQFRLVQHLARRHGNLCVVGDDDQSIYRWRGADRRNILEFRKSFPDARVIKLEQNYRSSKRILRAAHAVIRRNLDREPKELWTENAEGDPIVVVCNQDEREEARLVVQAIEEVRSDGYHLPDIAVFYRTHAQSRVIEEALRADNIPYRIIGGMRFYDRAEIKDALAYLRFLANPHDDVSLMRIINTPARGIGKGTIDRWLSVAAQRGVGAWEVLQDLDSLGLGGRARKALQSFISLVDALNKAHAESQSLVEFTNELLEKTGYLGMIRQDDSPEADARLQNLQELLTSIDQFETEAEQATLALFLQNIALQTSADEVSTDECVTLMTVHAAKGLEFPIVLVTGMEEQLFPFKGGDPWEDPEELEEERRLAYVAFTRARKRLVLSYASARRVFNQFRVGIPSRFLTELPIEDLHCIGGALSNGVQDTTWSDVQAASASSERSSHESYVDRSEGYDLEHSQVLPGARVKHPKFGVGEVRAVMEGSPPRVAVRFPGYGMRRIVTSFLEPA